jgi:hypothetical protein
MLMGGKKLLSSVFNPFTLEMYFGCFFEPINLSDEQKKEKIASSEISPTAYMIEDFKGRND